MKHPVYAIVLLSYTVAGGAATARMEPDAGVIKDFNRRVANYVKLHQSLRSKIHPQKPTASTEAIERYEHHLAHRIREARPGMVQGNIFTPAIAGEFRRLLGITMRGGEAMRIRESLQHGAPVHSHAVRVGRTYPAGAPLQSTPPSLLLNLPPLPPEVEYRVVGSNLILRDADANLVVDFIPNAIP